MNTPPVRTFTITSPIKACRLRRDDLKRLYRIFNDRQIEHRDSVLPQLVQQPNETPQQFQDRKTRVTNAFVVNINITGPNNEIVSGVGEHFLESENIPDDILMFYLTTTAGLNAIGIFEQQQQSRATLLLDFSRPNIFDFSRLPSLPTQNSSQFFIWSANEAWFTAFNTRLGQLFNESRTGFDWLHKPVYDLLVLLLGVPFALWIDYRLSATTLLNQLSIFVSAAF